jgi:hypothetical protein
MKRRFEPVLRLFNCLGHGCLLLVARKSDGGRPFATVCGRCCRTSGVRDAPDECVRSCGEKERTAGEAHRRAGDADECGAAPAKTHPVLAWTGRTWAKSSGRTPRSLDGDADTDVGPAELDA